MKIWDKHQSQSLTTFFPFHGEREGQIYETLNPAADTLRIVLYPLPQEYSHRELFGFWSSGPAESMPPPDPEEAVEKLIHTIRSDFVVV